MAYALIGSVDQGEQLHLNRLKASAQLSGPANGHYGRSPDYLERIMDLLQPDAGIEKQLRQGTLDNSLGYSLGKDSGSTYRSDTLGGIEKYLVGNSNPEYN